MSIKWFASKLNPDTILHIYDSDGNLNGVVRAKNVPNSKLANESILDFNMEGSQRNSQWAKVVIDS